MDEQKHPVVRRDSNIREILLGILVLAMAAAILTSNRPIWPTNRPHIVPVAPIPPRGELIDVANFIDIYAVTLPKVERVPLITRWIQNRGYVPRYAPTLFLRDAPPRLGYSYREITALGIPLIAYREFGYVAYLEKPWGFRVVPLDDGSLAFLNREAGAKLEQGFIFPFWETYWGLLLVAWVVGMLVFHIVADRRRRNVLGII